MRLGLQHRHLLIPTKVLEIVQELVKGIDMEDTDIIPSVFYGFMDGEDWNKKADLVGDQALRHLKVQSCIYA